MISSSVRWFFPACRIARPHRSSRLRGGRSPSISKLARLSASSKKLVARAIRWAPVCPTVSRALAARSSARNSVSALVRRMMGQNRPVPKRLSRTRCRFETVAANLLPGDPVWLLLIGPPGGGKTELLQPLGGLPNVHMTSTLTEASLLSGTPSKDKAKDASGGLLRSVGDFGVLLCKDFGSVLSMNRDSRTAVLAALREVYDGSWTRHVGVDGGRTLHWQGKLCFFQAEDGIRDWSATGVQTCALPI